MKNMRKRRDRDDANGSRFRGRLMEQPVIEIQNGVGKLSLDDVPLSPKNPNAMKPRKDVHFRSRGNTSSSRKEPITSKTLKDDPPVVDFSWVMKYLERDFTEPEYPVVSLDKRVLDEAKERGEELDELFFRACDDLRREAHEFATAAISYMRKKGHNLELVKPGLYSQGEIERGVRTHFNFKAKRADDPSAPVETYFGQLRYYGDFNLIVECCVSLGASDSLPYEADNRGCKYCRYHVHHPEGGCKGIKWGRLTWSPLFEMNVIT